MKEGWTYKKLGDVFRTYAGGTPSKTNKANYNNGTIPWIRSGEVCRKYITESELFISEEGLKNSSAKYYPINTVLVAMYGATAAQSGILKFEATSNQAVCGILPHKDFVPEFVYAFFTYIKDELASQAQGGAQPNISQEKIKKILFPCIPLSEQQRIVERLDSAFENIDKLKANAEKQLAEARTLFQKSLAKAMEPKEGWEEKNVKDLSLLITKGSSPKWQGNSYVDSDGILFVTSENVREGSLVLNPAKYVDKSFNQKQGRSILKKDDVLVNIVGASIGRAAIFDIDVDDANINQAVCLVRLDKQILSPRYLCLFLNSKHAFRQYAAMVKDTARANLSLENIGSLKIGVPSLAEQQRIVERLDSLSENVRKYEEIQRQIISECDALKQALLRKVFE